MSQSLRSAGCGTWIWGAALSAITADRHRGHQWKHAWNDQWKVERCAHQATVQRCPGCVQSRRLRQWREFCVYETVCALFAAVSNALTVFGCLRRRCIVTTSRIPLDRIRNQTAWTKTDCTASRLDVGVISRCLVRLADVEFAEMYLCGARLSKLGTSFPVLHVIVVLLCWLRKPGIVCGTPCVTFVVCCRMHPAVLVFTGYRVNA